MPVLTFIAVLLVSAILLTALLIVMLARTLLRPERMNDGKAILRLHRLSPGDLSLRFADVHFDVRDEQTGKPLHIAGWWIPADASSDQTILLLHGYSDAKVGSIAWAPLLHSLGWNILAIDLRAHGESGGVMTTAGFWERHDVSQVINLLRAERPNETRQLALFGVSLGAAVAVATAEGRDDLAGVILESPFADYRAAVSAHGEMRGLPEGWVREVAISLAEKMSGADFRAVRPQDLIARTHCPVMLIHAGLDPFIPAHDADALADALRARANPRDVLWSVPEAGHVLGFPTADEEYRRRIAEFLQSISGASAAAPPSTHATPAPPATVTSSSDAPSP